jgi:Icc-related predicted phosphoesterase
MMPKGDILIHCGDVTLNGTELETIDFLKWFIKQDYRHKIMIAGNHDYFLETNPEFVKTRFKDIHYLQDSSTVIDGIKYWGSPYTPEYKNMAFNLKRGEQLKKHWEKIPADVDVLITHGPPQGILDQTVNGDNVGCEHLAKRVERIKPKFHLFGHVHEASGMEKHGATLYVNASLTDKTKVLTQKKPFVVEYTTDV